ncbi:hypothetical protein Glove_54g160 [Diversispora epigaea]|uniref:Extracellular membrane protein CFEM domain-containing protein n=1 Tax=Diversispora epigaea TaxID=1348612 RepID=A0A397JJF1_9GLOM|nr:hypothetical protein Glove_54g160 [Diversispora epigaea]
MNSIRLYVFFLVALLTFVPIVRADCSNSAKYSHCMKERSAKSSSCTSTDYICLCSAVKDFSDCYELCTDDANTVSEASNYSQVVSATCSLASSQSLASLTATLAPAVNSQTPEPSSSSTVATSTSLPSESSSNDNSKIKNLIIGFFVGFALLGLLICFIYWLKVKSAKKTPDFEIPSVAQRNPDFETY